MSEILIPIDEVAELIGYSTKYIRKLSKDGNFKIKRVEGIDHLRWEDVKWLSRHYVPAWSLISDEMLDQPIPPERLRIHSNPITDFPLNTLQVGSCIDWMQKMPDGLVNTVVTSPPYWGMRRYAGNQNMQWADGSTSEFGVEPYVDEYIRHTTEILRHLKRVLRDDGVIWWNLGDTYVTRAVIRESTVERLDAFEGRRQDTWKEYPFKRYSSGHPYLKDKDLALVPFQVALAAQHIGLYVRSIIIWSKENTMPEPIKDRPTTSHEYILMLAKSRFYYYDSEAAKEPALTEALVRTQNGHESVSERNFRSVWTFPVSTWQHGEHTAAFPEHLPLRCIAATSKPGDIVFDPFVGSGTTAVVAARLGRQYFGCDLSEDYIRLAQKRIADDKSRQPKNGRSENQPIQRSLFED